MKATPGPWSIHTGLTPVSGCTIYSEEAGHAIAQQVRFNATIGMIAEEYDANARLIAAAPDLLAAVRDAYAHVALLGSGQTPPLSNAEMCELLGSALAKARGREET